MNDSPGRATPDSGPLGEPADGPPEQAAAPGAAGAPPADTARAVPEQRDGEAAGAPGAPGQAPASHWSEHQPPPAHGSSWGDAPTGGARAGRTRAGGGPAPQQPGGRDPGPQWGGPPGWGRQGQWSPPGGMFPPPAPKPGIVPLRPLRAGEIIGGAITALRTHWRTMLGVSLAFAVLTEVVVTVVNGLWFDAPGSTTPSASDALSSSSVSLNPSDYLGTSFSSLIDLLGSVVVTALLTVVVGRAVLGRRTTTGEAWHDARGRLLRLLALLVLLPLGVALVVVVGAVPGLLLIAADAPRAGGPLALFGCLVTGCLGVWLWIRYSLAAPALMLEKQGALQALRRSAKLTRGAWWRVLGVQLLAYLVTGLVQFVLQIPALIVAFILDADHLTRWMEGRTDAGWTVLICMGVAGVVSSALAFPFTAGVTALLYMDQRVRRESLDVELGRAAGIPGYDQVPGPHTTATTPPA
ncbi:hypothetical protein ACFV3R_04710 [Streptomyces sp. NPDC059740]|uniref:hypothetical protein n=1 Tax=Streptomyces sp. NPDC059740 TaxID=3346926 RepID=UPI00365F9269